MKRRMLYIEDNDVLRRAFERLMSKDYDITALENGQEALDLLQTRDDFDFIVSDVDMPYMTGFELYQWVKDQKPKLASRFILMSGLEHPEIRKSKVTFLTKPVGSNELESAINSLP
jgi:CheY-like chemotaxis protein